MKLTRRSKSGLIAIAATLLLSVAVVGIAQQGRGGAGHFDGGFHGGPRGERGPRGGGGLVPFARELNLTDEQKAQIQKLAAGLEESTKSLREQLRAQHGSEFSALKDGAFDEATVRAAAQARASVQVELEVARARTMAQVYALLTAEQKAKVSELRQQFEQRGPGRGPGRGGDDRPDDN